MTFAAFALALALVAGMLLAALVCKAIRFRLWVDLIAGLGAISGTGVVATFAEHSAWPLFGLPAGFLVVVVFLRLFPVKEST